MKGCPRTRILLLAAVFSSACSSSPTEQACLAEEALVNGTARESYLGLAPSQIGAIVAVVEGTRPNGALCSGAFIAPSWVVTAKHCLVIESAQVLVQGNAEEPFTALRVVAATAHPSLELALLQVEGIAGEAAPGDGGVTISPLRAGGMNIATLAAGDVVELAGYGLTETGSVRSLRFVAEPILRIDETTITVTGRGETGACAGDSGGPLLLRAPSGEPQIAGVLHEGSASCRDQDIYVRLDGAEDWIRGVVGDYAAGLECGAITEQGRCLYGSAMWCSGASLRAEHCSGNETCGWDAMRRYRCVDKTHDPCGSAPDPGE